MYLRVKVFLDFQWKKRRVLSDHHCEPHHKQRYSLLSIGTIRNPHSSPPKYTNYIISLKSIYNIILSCVQSHKTHDRDYAHLYRYKCIFSSFLAELETPNKIWLFKFLKGVHIFFKTKIYTPIPVQMGVWVHNIFILSYRDSVVWYNKKIS